MSYKWCFFFHISAALFILRSRSRATAAATEDEFLQCNNGPVIQHGQIQVLVARAWQGFDFLAGFGRELGFPKQVFHRSRCFVFFSASEIGFQHPTWAKWVSKTWQIHLTIQIIPKNPSEIFEALLENVVQSWLQQTRDNRAGTRDLQRSPSVVDVMGIIEYDGRTMGMDQYLLIPFLGGWTSIYRLFWCSPELLKCWKSWIGGRGARNELFFWKRWLISGCMTITDECQNFGCCFEGNILFETYKINDRRENKLNQITALRFVVLLENYASIYDNGRSTHEHSQFTSTICGQ